ncbi:MAG: hypothetical protein ACXWV6_15945 [Chitinophagaceae bacterium]
MSTSKGELKDDPLSGVPEDPALIPGDFNNDKFYPTGAIAFFIALVILCLAIWFGIYFLMLERI